MKIVKKRKRKTYNVIDSVINKLILDKQFIFSIERKPINGTITVSSSKKKRTSLNTVFVERPGILLHSSTVEERLKEVHSNCSLDRDICTVLKQELIHSKRKRNTKVCPKNTL